VIIFSIAFPFFLFIKLSEDVIKQELTVFDDTVYNFIARFITPNMTYFMKFLTYCASGPVLISLTVIIFIALHRNKKRLYYGWIIVINLVASATLNEIFKIVFHRERPDILRLIDITGYSFPSGHSMISICYYGLIAYILYKTMKSRWKYLIVFLLATLILSIGISRIYLGVHYASDVIGGFSAGLAWLAVFITFSNRVQKNMVQTDKRLLQNE
jgi:undecaprenyl-diphosphatase